MAATLVSKLIEKLSRRAGVKVHLEPKWGYVGVITFPNGRKSYFRNTNFDLNPLGAAEIAKDKSYASYFLARHGYPIARDEASYSPRWCKVIGSHRGMAAAYRYARKLGFPVFVKPNSRSQGFGVTKVFTQRDFFRAVKFICRREKVFLVQEVLQGNDYRIVVLDREVISAYQRLPLSVVGDGKSCISRLFAAKQQEFIRIGRDTQIDRDDFRITLHLARLGMTFRSVPKRGERVYLLDNANLSTGGDAVDVTPSVHPAWRRLAVRITRDMGLRFCGVDVMVRGDLCTEPSRYTVIEVNAAPGLDHYATIGKPQRRLVESLYLKVVIAMGR